MSDLAKFLKLFMAQLFLIAFMLGAAFATDFVGYGTASVVFLGGAALFVPFLFRTGETILRLAEPDPLDQSTQENPNDY